MSRWATRYPVCPGFDEFCGEFLAPETAWTVGGTRHRDEWQACERCAMEALRYTYAEVYDSGGEQVLEEAS